MRGREQEKRNVKERRVGREGNQKRQRVLGSTCRLVETHCSLVSPAARHVANGVSASAQQQQWLVEALHKLHAPGAESPQQCESGGGAMPSHSAPFPSETTSWKNRAGFRLHDEPFMAEAHAAVGRRKAARVASRRWGGWIPSAA